jgi:regulator of replication initiation timing
MADDLSGLEQRLGYTKSLRFTYATLVQLCQEAAAALRTLDSHGPEGHNVTNLQFQQMRDRAEQAEAERDEMVRVAGEALGTDPAMRGVGCVAALVGWLEQVQAERDAARFGVHLRHCNHGEWAGVCKYGNADCPMLTEDWAWVGRHIDRSMGAEQEVARLTGDKAAAEKRILALCEAHEALHLENQRLRKALGWAAIPLEALYAAERGGKSLCADVQQSIEDAVDQIRAALGTREGEGA